MIITSLGKIILHMPKCASSSIRWALHDQADARGFKVHWISAHAPLSSTPKQYQNWPVIGFIRNPGTWYISWYNQKLQGHRKGERNAILSLVLSDGFKIPFDEFLYNATHLQEFFSQGEHIDKLRLVIRNNLMRYLTNWITLIWQDIHGIGLETFTNIDVNTLFDWWFKQIGMESANEIYRIEDGVQRGFDLAFPNSGVRLKHMNKLPDQQRRRLALSPDQKEMVRSADKRYFNRFNYLT